MKFGKVINESQIVSAPGWKSSWLNYKRLKKIIKLIEDPADNFTLQNTKSLADILSSRPLEVEFFTVLHEELEKVSSFYEKTEHAMCIQYRGLIQSFSELRNSGALTRNRFNVSNAETLNLLGMIARFHTDLIMLENFAVMNYCGFGKILKKHDKRTKFSTQVPYMSSMVNKRSFARYSRLLTMLQHTEAVYGQLTPFFPEDVRRTSLGQEYNFMIKGATAMHKATRRHRCGNLRQSVAINDSSIESAQSTDIQVITIPAPQCVSSPFVCRASNVDMRECRRPSMKDLDPRERDAIEAIVAVQRGQ